jgi:polyisoprenyl-teichoic acid--peptidoglycan teichoic acid transferase
LSFIILIAFGSDTSNRVAVLCTDDLRLADATKLMFKLQYRDFIVSQGQVEMMRWVRVIAPLIIVLGALGTYRIQAQDEEANDVPAPAEMISEGDYDIVNYLLLGSDTTNSNNGRTDVIVVVSVNRSVGTVALLSIPRDLYVYTPEYGMGRINSAYGYGELASEGTGYERLNETIKYNLGLEIDGYARLNFNGFRTLVDSLGGIEIAVDCGIQDWRLREPELDPQVEENWEMFTLPIGIHTLDGDLALWYARSRRTSSDFDRGRRHQVILRAMYHKIRQMGLIEQIHDVWGQVTEIIETDIALDEMIALGTTALSLRPDQLASYTFRPTIEAQSWRAPDGASVQLPVQEAVEGLLQQFMSPATTLQIGQEQPHIQVINASGVNDLGWVAGERLAWEGFDVTVEQDLSLYQQQTTLIDYTGQSKGSSLAQLQSVLRVEADDVTVEPTGERAFDFRVVLGGDYYACTYNVAPPVPLDDEGS